MTECHSAIDALCACLQDCADELAIYIDNEHPHRGQYPVEQRRYERDMALVERALALLAEMEQHL